MNIIENEKIKMPAITDLCTLPINIFENNKSQEAFWDDEHISKQMLDAHLNPNWDAASRKQNTIKSTCDWIDGKINSKRNVKLLDLGCGPGLYSSILYDKGFQVTGIDYSKRSIEYAKKEAASTGRQIEYIYQDYLKMDYNHEYDAAIMIYCDFGVLSNENRGILLKKIHQALKKGGYFIFDVWSSEHNQLKQSSKEWLIHKEGGFWSESPYIELINMTYYERDHVSLNQHVIIKETGETNVYNLWEQLYTPESIRELLNTYGFETIHIYSDLTGNEYHESSKVLGVVARVR